MPRCEFHRHVSFHALFFSGVLISGWTGCSKVINPFDSGSKQENTTVTLVAKVRDFHEGNATSSVGTHPHFNQNKGSCDAQALGVKTVSENLDTSAGTDPKFPGDNRGPVLLQPVNPAIAKCFDPPERFSDWFQDRGPDTNRAFLVNLAFDQDARTGNYVYRNNSFFPIDAGASFVKDVDGGPDPFGNLQTGTKDSVDLSLHNYGFTLELHTAFTYRQGQGQYIAFEGDDDLWAFVDGKRVVDLGGIHSAEKDSVKLDDIKDALGLADQAKCHLDFFFAERNVASSKLSIVTNVKFEVE